MKSSIYCLIILVGLFFSSQLVLAENFDLDFFAKSDSDSKLSSDLSLSVNETSYIIPGSEVRSWLIEKTFLDYKPGYDSEIENNRLCLYQKSLICNLSISSRQGNHLCKKTFVKLDSSLVKKSVTNFAQNINKAPIDARLKIENGKVSTFSLSEKGLLLDEDKSVEKIIDYLKSPVNSASIDLPYEKTNPEVVTDMTENIKIDTLLGEGHSNFRGSPKNRVFNIKAATSRFDGILIKPEEEFSFVRVLGEVDGEHGYLPELVIKKDKTEPEFGGGICQVSTTAFRAAIYSGLIITARQNHAYPVSYYNPQGMDSTVYIPRPDLRFKNNTPGHILIQTEIKGTELTFRFYGTSDGRAIKVIGPTVLEKNPDGSMKTTFTQQVYDQDANLIREMTFKSNYDSPSKYPHPASSTDLLSEKPKGWSDHEWKTYKNAHALP